MSSPPSADLFQAAGVLGHLPDGSGHVDQQSWISSKVVIGWKKSRQVEVGLDKEGLARWGLTRWGLTSWAWRVGLDKVHLDLCSRSTWSPAPVPPARGSAPCNSKRLLSLSQHSIRPMLREWKLVNSPLSLSQQCPCLESENCGNVKFHFLDKVPPNLFSWLLALSAIAPTIFVSTCEQHELSFGTEL